jgi:hypothetical protein
MWRVGPRSARTATVAEERGTYDDAHRDPDRGVEGVEHIGDVLGRLIEERGWPLPPRIVQANGHRSGGNDGSRHADA